MIDEGAPGAIVRSERQSERVSTLAGLFSDNRHISQPVSQCHGGLRTYERGEHTQTEECPKG